MCQDENHKLIFDQKQIQAKCIKFNEDNLNLRQEIQEVSDFIGL